MNMSDELERLQSLHERGVLTADEFARAKSRLLGESLSFEAPPGGQSHLHQLRRSQKDRVLGGVCGGLGQYTGLPAWAWRVLFCLTFFGLGFGLLVYLLLWLFMPLDS